MSPAKRAVQTKRPPCIACGSRRINSNGKEEWLCLDCGKRFSKTSTWHYVTRRESQLINKLWKQGIPKRKIAEILGRHLRTIVRHTKGRVVPKY